MKSKQPNNLKLNLEIKLCKLGIDAYVDMFEYRGQKRLSVSGATRSYIFDSCDEPLDSMVSTLKEYWKEYHIKKLKQLECPEEYNTKD